MPDTVTDKEVDSARSRVTKLREQIRAEKAKVQVNSTEAENAVRKAALDTEADRLEAELAALKDANKASNVREVQKDIINRVSDPSPTQPPAPDQTEGA